MYTITYGVEGNAIDVTVTVYNKLIKQNILYIPDGDANRAFYFNDPVPYVLKSVFITDPKKPYKILENSSTGKRPKIAFITKKERDSYAAKYGGDGGNYEVNSIDDPINYVESIVIDTQGINLWIYLNHSAHHERSVCCYMCIMILLWKCFW